MKHRIILPVAGLLLLIAALGYAVIRLVGIPTMWWLLFLPWQLTLLLFLAGLVGSFMIRLGPEHSRRLAGHGLSCMMVGFGMIGLDTIAAINFSQSLHDFFGALIPLLFMIWHITGLVLVVAGAALSIRAALKGLFTPPLAKPGHCAVCGYNRSGLPKRRCPECGTPF